MSTWTSKIARPWLLALTGLLGVSGCLGSGGDVQRDVIRTVSLSEGDVVVRAPDGYCIDKRSLRDSASQGFVMLASCESLSGVRGQNVEPVIMTLAVVPNGAKGQGPSSSEIASSLSGAPVIEAIDDADLSLVHFASGGNHALAEKDPKHWRGAMAINGHLIALSLYGRKGSPMTGTEGHLLLRALARNTKASSPVRPLIVESSAEQPVAAAVEPAAAAVEPPVDLPVDLPRALWGVLFPNSG